jgi:hypothetical protein
MAEFASEAAVRLQAQVEDVGIASAELVAACIAEAHEHVLAELGSAVDVESPPTAVVQGETLRAAAVLLRALASRDAVEQVEVQIGGQRVDAGQKFAALMSIARRFEKEAGSLLGPYGAMPEAASPGEVSATTPVLGVLEN